nr:DUF4179 domain-containing protein [Metabacillus kandeliae]
MIPAVLSAVIVLSLFFASSFSPAFAHKLKSLPVISAIFASFGDQGLQQAEKQELSHKTNQFVTIGKSTFQLTDVVYDGARLFLGYHIANYQKEDELIFSKSALYINGKKFSGGGSGSGAVIQPHEYAGVRTYDLPAEIRDQKGIATLVFNAKQKLHFPIQVSKGAGDGDSAEK